MTSFMDGPLCLVTLTSLDLVGPKPNIFVNLKNYNQESSRTKLMPQKKKIFSMLKLLFECPIVSQLQVNYVQCEYVAHARRPRPTPLCGGNNNGGPGAVSNAKGPVNTYGEGEGATKQYGGGGWQVTFYPYKKGAGNLFIDELNIISNNN